ncbi:hypothetical protein AA14337_3182 [Acetobacter malorum DSM 14337]|uniref:Uncharacterized protein n=1 Tax=Acetobacter malorum DSM 14337 TaxID=1307910 RepID=A0ABQ0Q041_9PROT|nr:hypothetical protein [Acetobacter malorum]GBQ85868.1 hypothetical protein AA14337_3182 [Acetobacter malorum DSM 14337]
MHVEISVALDRMKAIRCPKCKTNNVLLGEGRTLSEDRADRDAYFQGEREPGLTSRKNWWLEFGEKGSSSKFLFNMLSEIPDIRLAVPSDASDFRRCVLLLDLIPEWRDKLELRMAKAPDPWPELARNWDSLERTLRKESPDLDFFKDKPTSFGGMLQIVISSKKQ